MPLKLKWLLLMSALTKFTNNQRNLLRTCTDLNNCGTDEGPEGEPSAPYGAGNNQKIENIQAFLYQIARNLVTDFYREKAKTQVVSAESAQINDPRTNLEEKVLLSSDIDTVRQALGNLKDNYQVIIIWHYLDDLSIPEIAKILEKPEGTVRVTLHRALKALKNELG